MKKIALTQRVDRIESYGERRDALDQRWPELLLQAGLLPVIIPNNRIWLDTFLPQQSIDGVLLTGGNSLVRYGGNAPERDAVENLLLDHAIALGLPVLGICRGMQLILDRAGIPLQTVSGHVAAEQEIEIEGVRVKVNSYHDWGTRETNDQLEVWAKADDGVIKAVHHQRQRLWGIMWHPERFHPFRAEDIALLGRVFCSGDEVS
jgi:putative glutamine amidotransferase